MALASLARQAKCALLLLQAIALVASIVLWACTRLLVALIARFASRALTVRKILLGLPLALHVWSLMSTRSAAHLHAQLVQRTTSALKVKRSHAVQPSFIRKPESDGACRAQTVKIATTRLLRRVLATLARTLPRPTTLCSAKQDTTRLLTT